MTALRVEDLRVRYGRKLVLDGLSLEVPAGACFALLGASGGGKSTLLAAVAGLVRVERGRILLDEEDVTSHPPERRGIGVVFQSYALFPNLTALDNIAFGVMQQGVPRVSARERAGELARRLGLAEVLSKLPSTLSGGEQQRVALARALAIRPRLLLMDEPLSNIDPALRESVRVQLRELRDAFAVTTVLVTHDREDAFWLADTIGLLREGRIVQVGSPAEIYRRPIDQNAAELLGPASHLPWGQLDGVPRIASLRPEDVRFVAALAPGVVVGSRMRPAIVEAVVDLGHDRRALCRLASGDAVWAGRLTGEVAVGQSGMLELPDSPWLLPDAGAAP